MSFPSKAERQRCNTAREQFWQCLDQGNVTNNQIPDHCKELRKIFESSCPGQWVKHFDRKREYEIFKAKMNQGFDPLEERK